MIRNRKVKVAVFAAVITTIQFGGNARGDDGSNNYNRDGGVNNQIECRYMKVRATIYNKHEKGCDSETKKGHTTTGITLREANTKVIGVAGTNAKIIPPGSLILVTTKNGDTYPYLSADSGGGVTNKKHNAAIGLAKMQKLSREWATRPVVDLYSDRTVTSDWATVLVIQDHSIDGLKGAERLKRLQERMSIGYWESRGLVTSDQRIRLLAQNK